ncbi:MAG: alpha/beta hydrolase [Planctomycetaceae bacterium]|jgi:pimeloyl-ACP methyl ester carboxylesterase|nr:alpha/beta hydrolase [Planctomycetaceae bacterium]
MDVIGLVSLLGLGLVFAWATGVAYTLLTIMRPPRRGEGWAVARGMPRTPADLGLEFSTWEHRARGGRVVCPVSDVRGRRPDGPTVVLMPGWGESRVTMLLLAAKLAEQAARVVVWDPPGHGDASGGVCTVGQKEAADLHGLLEVVAKPGGRVVLAGFSLGAGVSLDVAAKHPQAVAGVLAVAPYRLPITPGRGVMSQTGMPWRLTLGPALWLLGAAAGADWGGAWLRASGGFDRAKAAGLAGEAGVEVTVVSGEWDVISPAEDGRAIAEAAGERGRLVQAPQAAHLDLIGESGSLAVVGGAMAALVERINAGPVGPSARGG